MRIYKNNRAVFILLAAAMLCIVLVSCAANTLDNAQPVQSGAAAEAAPVIDGMKLVSAMFPEESFRKQGKTYNAGERNNYYIESIIPGSFVNKGKDELMVVVRRPRGELAHAAGFYNAYMAVFDNMSGELVSEVKLFAADEGEYKLFDSEGVSYISFIGNVTYQGWTNYSGGLWQADRKWALKWPAAEENKEYYDFWEKRAAEFGHEGIINIFDRKTLPKKNENQTMPDYTWEHSYRIIWDEVSGSFVKIISDYEIMARQLLDRNIESFSQIFYLQTLPVDTPDGSYGAGIYPVKSDKFKTYADLESFVRNTYIKKEADYLLTNFSNMGPQYMDIDGRLHTDKSKEGGIGYYIDWEDYNIKLKDITDDNMIVIVTVKELEIGSEPITEKDLDITVKLIKENGKWLLERMVY